METRVNFQAPLPQHLNGHRNIGDGHHWPVDVNRYVPVAEWGGKQQTAQELTADIAFDPHGSPGQPFGIHDNRRTAIVLSAGCFLPQLPQCLEQIRDGPFAHSWYAIQLITAMSKRDYGAQKPHRRARIAAKQVRLRYGNARLTSAGADDNQ